MGIEIDRSEFSPADYAAFRARLEDNLQALQQLLERPGFGQGPGSLGAELELYIVDAAGRPLHANHEILERADDPQLTLELNRYNLEYNLTPYALHARPLRATERELLHKLERGRAAAAGLGGRLVSIGILPTLRPSDFGAHCITDRKRYHALVAQLLRRRGGQFRIDIDGLDPLRLEMADITLEGANTSFQVHYRVAPAHFADTFNAMQLATPLALAVAANSPTLFGHSLWHETRVPLFKQSIDTRRGDRYGWRAPARVNFGQGWVRRDALELFREVVRIYPPLLPLCAARPPAREAARADGLGAAPPLAELRLHQSTVWLWNRPVYDNVDGGHLRIEMRSLPAGPTARDMVANAALLIGLAEGLRPALESLLPALPFNLAEYNFYRAAQHGLNARLIWPTPRQSGYREQPVCAIIRDLLPLAADGLARIGIDAAEAQCYLDVIERRLQRRASGAIWQQQVLSRLRRDRPLQHALHELLELYMMHSARNVPVAEWPV
ncbi:MAG: glutamate--cysteine ligase [Halioglobus sp.]|nr:glutamate--cysteine ligase [Halioglobus sp.]